MKEALKPVEFTSKDTRFIKGFAILLLMWHHLCASPDTYYTGTTFPSIISFGGRSLTSWFADMGNISITIFSFLGGYALARCYERPHFFSGKIIAIYKNFWKIFFIFVPIGFLFFAHQTPYNNSDYVLHRFEQFDLQGLLFNLVGFSTSYNIEWWFFFPYLKALLVGLVFIYLNRKRRSYYVEFAEMLLLMMIVSMLLSLPHSDNYAFIVNNSFLNDYFYRTEIVTCVIMGTIFGKYNLLPRLINWTHTLPFVIRKAVSIVVILFILVQRNGVPTYDYIFVPLLTVALFELFGFSAWIYKCMEYVGRNSSNMYYMHTFLIFYFGACARLIYKPNNSLVSFLIFVGSCLLISIAINRFYMVLGKLLSRSFLFRQGVFETKSDEVKAMAVTAEPVAGAVKDDKYNIEATSASEPDTLPETIFVDDYSAPIRCDGCGRELKLGKMFCSCSECGIYYVKNKYKDDNAIGEMCSGSKVIWIKKK